MQLQSLLTALAALGIGMSPVLALPEAVPELVDGAQLAERAQCIAGGKQAGSHCEAGNLGATACSNDNTALMKCQGSVPKWHITKSCHCSYCQCV